MRGSFQLFVEVLIHFIFLARQPKIDTWYSVTCTGLLQSPGLASLGED